jgi:hypothetical protein
MFFFLLLPKLGFHEVFNIPTSFVGVWFPRHEAQYRLICGANVPRQIRPELDN